MELVGCDRNWCNPNSGRGAGAHKLNIGMKANQLKLMPLGIDTRNEHTVYMRDDYPVCTSERFEALTRIRVGNQSKTIVASLNVLVESLLEHDEVELSEKAIKALGSKTRDLLPLSYLHPIDSMDTVCTKVFRHCLREKTFT